jgi:hypothetical protein
MITYKNILGFPAANQEVQTTFTVTPSKISATGFLSEQQCTMKFICTGVGWGWGVKGVSLKKSEFGKFWITTIV